MTHKNGDFMYSAYQCTRSNWSASLQYCQVRLTWRVDLTETNMTKFSSLSPDAVKSGQSVTNMMTWSNGNIFRVTGHLCGEFTGDRCCNIAVILLIYPLGTNFSELLIEIHALSFEKMHVKMSSAKRRPFCLGLNVVRHWSCYNATALGVFTTQT